MKSFFVFFRKSMPLGIGIVLALISIAFAVNIADNGGSETSILGALFFGVLGFPMAISGAIKLGNDPHVKGNCN